ncbi:hypothetical protein ACHAXR_005920 [Thalassiosira sp. AJA248-18]
MKSAIALIAAAVVTAPAVMGFAPSSVTTIARPTTDLCMAEDGEEFMRWAKQSRSASSGDNLVEMKRPLGLVLDEDDNGNVFVQTVAPRGNAARSGLVKEGDIVTMCSATFGDQMWSCRGVGLTRVLAAIRVRAGPTVSLVFESTSQRKVKGAEVAKQAAAAREAKVRAQAKRDDLLKELESDEKKLKKGKFLGLF